MLDLNILLIVAPLSKNKERGALKWREIKDLTNVSFLVWAVKFKETVKMDHEKTTLPFY